MLIVQLLKVPVPAVPASGDPLVGRVMLSASPSESKAPDFGTSGGERAAIALRDRLLQLNWRTSEQVAAAAGSQAPSNPSTYANQLRAQRKLLGNSAGARFSLCRWNCLPGRLPSLSRQEAAGNCPD